MPESTTPRIASRISVGGGVVHRGGPHVGVVGVDDVAVRVADVAQHVGPITSPPLATAPATIAICSGVAATSFWPIADWARAGGFCSKSVGKFERAGAVRSIGTSWLKPKSSDAVDHRRRGRCRRPSGRRRVLHDTRRIWNSAPPHELPPKLRIGRVVPGGV